MKTIAVLAAFVLLAPDASAKCDSQEYTLNIVNIMCLIAGHENCGPLVVDSFHGANALATCETAAQNFKMNQLKNATQDQLKSVANGDSMASLQFRAWCLATKPTPEKP